MATIIFRDGTGNVTGFGGYMYEQLQWISHYLDFRYIFQIKMLI